MGLYSLEKERNGAAFYTFGSQLRGGGNRGDAGKPCTSGGFVLCFHARPARFRRKFAREGGCYATIGALESLAPNLAITLLI